MSPIGFSPSSLKEGRWDEYSVRFALGGAATVFTGIVSSSHGASVGGLFLALPAIFCASATLIEKHEIRCKREAGLDGRRRGEDAAALDAAGAALGRGLVRAPQDAVGPEKAERGQNQRPRGLPEPLKSKRGVRPQTKPSR